MWLSLANAENIHKQKMKLNLNFIYNTKLNSKWIIDLNVKCKMRKLLGDNS